MRRMLLIEKEKSSIT